MDLNEVYREIEALPINNREAIVGLINTKTNEDMKEVLQEIRSLKADMDNRFAAIDSKFTAIDSKFTAIESRFKTINWVLGIVGSAIVAALFTFIFK